VKSLALLCNGTPLEMEPGIHFDMPRSDYDRIPALSSTVIRKWLSLGAKPEDFLYWLMNRWDEPVTEAKLVGSALDTLVLEPGKFGDRFAVVPEGAPTRPGNRLRNARKPSPATLEAIAYWDKFLGKAEGKEVLTADQHGRATMMCSALRHAEGTEHVFTHCRKAVLLAELFGVPCKCEIDCWNEKVPHIMDVKSAQSVSGKGFVKAIIDYQYVEQATWYLLMANACGVKKKIFSFVAVKNEEPWSIKALNFRPQQNEKHVVIFDACQKRLCQAAEIIAKRLEARNWRDEQQWTDVEFPEWYLRQAEAEAVDAFMEEIA
jgi:PDDEXK-like domain of unknown function (DUF3799)